MTDGLTLAKAREFIDLMRACDIPPCSACGGYHYVSTPYGMKVNNNVPTKECRGGRPGVSIKLDSSHDPSAVDAPLPT